MKNSVFAIVLLALSVSAFSADKKENDKGHTLSQLQINQLCVFAKDKDDKYRERFYQKLDQYFVEMNLIKNLTKAYYNIDCKYRGRKLRFHQLMIASGADFNTIYDLFTPEDKLKKEDVLMSHNPSNFKETTILDEICFAETGGVSNDKGEVCRLDLQKSENAEISNMLLNNPDSIDGLNFKFTAKAKMSCELQKKCKCKTEFSKETHVCKPIKSLKAKD